MPKKKTEKETKRPTSNPNVLGLQAQVLEQPITQTLETNYMPYAMSVIVSRAIPEIDGFKPSHRKLLYTMYKMGLLTGPRTKSANIVGQTMRLNPHGDAAIYETMVRLSRGNGALLTPFVDSKGNFGKVYSRDMSYAAPRYTEAKLSSICSELFRDIDSDTVDFVDNYDGTMKEPGHRRGYGQTDVRLQPDGVLPGDHRLPERPGLRRDAVHARPGLRHGRRNYLQ